MCIQIIGSRLCITYRTNLCRKKNSHAYRESTGERNNQCNKQMYSKGKRIYIHDNTHQRTGIFLRKSRVLE